SALGPREVEDVLGEGEARGDDSCVDDAVDRSVEVLAPQQEDREDAHALEDLLDHRRTHDGTEDVGPQRVSALGVDEARVGRVEHHGAGGGDSGTPGERGDEQPAWLGLPAVDPHDRRDHAGQRHHCDDAGDDGGAGTHLTGDVCDEEDGPDQAECDQEDLDDQGRHGTGAGLRPQRPGGRRRVGGGRHGPQRRGSRTGYGPPADGQSLGSVSSMSNGSGIGARPARRKYRTTGSARSRRTCSTWELWNRRASWMRYQDCSSRSSMSPVRGSSASPWREAPSPSTVRRVRLSSLSISALSDLSSGGVAAETSGAARKWAGVLPARPSGTTSLPAASVARSTTSVTRRVSAGSNAPEVA